MTDPRDPIREALSSSIGRRVKSLGYARHQAMVALAALDGLRVVQPGEIVLTAEEAKRIRMLLEGVTGWRQMREEFIALLASGPGGEAEA